MPFSTCGGCWTSRTLGGHPCIRMISVSFTTCHIVCMSIARFYSSAPRHRRCQPVASRMLHDAEDEFQDNMGKPGYAFHLHDGSSYVLHAPIWWAVENQCLTDANSRARVGPRRATIESVWSVGCPCRGQRLVTRRGQRKSQCLRLRVPVSGLG